MRKGEGEEGGEKGEVRWRSVRGDSWSDRLERWLTALYIFICIFSPHNLYLVRVYIHIRILFIGIIYFFFFTTTASSLYVLGININIFYV